MSYRVLTIKLAKLHGYILSMKIIEGYYIKKNYNGVTTVYFDILRHKMRLLGNYNCNIT